MNKNQMNWVVTIIFINSIQKFEEISSMTRNTSFYHFPTLDRCFLSFLWFIWRNSL